MAGSGSEEQQKAGSSISALVSTLIPSLIIFAVFILIFTLLRKKQKRVYEPRTNVSTLPKDLKPDETPRGLFGWLGHIMSKPESFLIQHTGVDGYFFIRFLFGFASICFLGCLVCWPVLFPVNIVKGVGKTGFDMLSYANVKDKYRTFAHVFVSWLFFGTVVFFMYREIVYYTTFRHVVQTTPLYDSMLSSRTLLLTEIDEQLYDEATLRNYFPTATNIWYGRDVKTLQDKVKERTKLSKKYEGALNKVINGSTKLRLKLTKKKKPLPEPSDDLNKYLKDGKKRPTHKLKFLIGEKVDTLNYGVERLGELNKDIKKDQLEYHSFKQIPAVFIEFPSQLELQRAYQAIPFNTDFKGAKRFNGLAPNDIIWENLSLTPWKRRIKKIIASTVLTLMIIFWAIPVAVVGAISNINMLTDKVKFLSFINKMPGFLMGVITGLLPVVALAVLMSLVPPFIRKMGKVSGLMTVQQVEGYCQSWYFAFQMVHSFLVVTVASAAASTVTTIISDPSKALNLLGQNIPPASNFYLAYFCLQGLAISSGILVQIVALILAQFLGKILDKTPRSKWTRYTTLGQPSWSVVYPLYQFLGSIAIIYAIISPLLLGFAFIAFVLIYFAWNYSLIYVTRPNIHDSRGRNYPRALLQLYTGLYLAQVCLVALFVFNKNWACVALEAVCIAACAAAHIYMKYKFLPLFDIVPISAIKYAAGDSTFQYPMHDQGSKEIKVEGENYWDGGNQLGLKDQKDQVLPTADLDQTSPLQQPLVPGTHGANSMDGNNPTIIDSDDSKHNDDYSKFTHDSKAPINNKELLERDPEKSGNFEPSPTKGVSWLKRFFQPKTESFDLIRKVMPAAYFNYVEYHPDFLRNAYNDPAIANEEPHIWVARDEMGLSEIEKNKALENGVDVSDDNAKFDEKGNAIYTGPPPSYEDSIRV
ncbi:phosphate metabolism protein 7 [[Candida] jaroonii]|uniref:Phosphate metabolism protein 7 n=1 Tax=[Candida] jaroonii TaxID=467808 RepID=A0ACA9Y3Z6_9ASCO|nr:phosphate metabolism protein 7 [[Candida] jaroonii]